MLSQLGWDDEWEAALAAAGPDLAAARIVAEHRGAYQATGSRGSAWVELPGRTFHRARDKRDLPTVGDWVAVERWEQAVERSGSGVVRAILPRRSLIVRKAAGERTAPQPLAANVSMGVIVSSANLDLSLRRVERYLALLADAGVTPILLLNKIDLVEDARPLLNQLESLAAGAACIATSGQRSIGIEALAARLAGVTSVFLGSSGVGKSTLINQLLGRAEQPTHAIGHDDRGLHTTTHRQLLVGDNGSVVIDTPGMRELGLWSDEESPLEDSVFADIDALAAGCRFSDCRHRQEPGCAVEQAAKRGELDAARLASYRKLSEERQRAEERTSGAQRIAQRRLSKAARDVGRRKRPP